jgi:catechol 2,3-dioxygenase-like lactoylglutathione lyase family enzyme
MNRERSRWRSLPTYLVLLFATVAATTGESAQPSTGPGGKTAVSAPLVGAVDSIGITVGDMDRAVAFYSGVLTFEKVSDTEVAGDTYEHLYGVFGMRLRLVRMRLGDEHVELMQFLAPRGRPAPADSRSNDHWFQHVAIIVSDMDRAYARLRTHKVEHASSGPQVLPQWNRNAGGIAAFYFRDPDGNTLEILSFPPDKGERRWQGKDRLFLGIDHTAIVVADSERSLRFYRDTLGLEVAGAAENYGTEQEHLNNVFGARLRITALRAARGPGVELLEYLAPRTGRPMPVDTLANDAWHWQINMHAPDVAIAATALRAGRYTEVSSGITIVEAAALGFASGFMVRDPDGHASLLARVNR